MKINFIAANATMTLSIDKDECIMSISTSKGIDGTTLKSGADYKVVPVNGEVSVSVYDLLNLTNANRTIRGTATTQYEAIQQ